MTTMPASKAVDDYLAKLQGPAREHLMRIRTILTDIIPDGELKISYNLPTLTFGKYNAFHFAAYKNHVSLFPSSYAIEHFAAKLSDYKHSGSAIQFTHAKPLPEDLIREIAIWRRQFMLDQPDKG